jgi:hypothetical protein
MTIQHQKFCEDVIKGCTLYVAYANAFQKKTITPAVKSAANRLAASPHIKNKIAELRARAEEISEAEAVLTLVEKRKFLARIVRTPVSILHPDKKDTHDLIKKVITKTIGAGEDCETILEIEGYDKIKAITEDTNLAGDGAESEHFRTLNTLLNNIPIAGMVTPTDKMI